MNNVPCTDTLTMDILIPSIGRYSLKKTLDNIGANANVDKQVRIIVCADKSGDTSMVNYCINEFIKSHLYSFNNIIYLEADGITNTYRTLFENAESDLCMIMEDDDYLKEGDKNLIYDIISYFSTDMFLSSVILNIKKVDNYFADEIYNKIKKENDLSDDENDKLVFNFSNYFNINNNNSNIKNIDLFNSFPDVFNGEFQFGMCVFKTQMIKNIAIDTFTEIKNYGRTYNDEYIFLKFLLNNKNFYSRVIDKEYYLTIAIGEDNYSHKNTINSLLGIDYINELYQLSNNKNWYNKMKNILIREVNLVLKENNYLPLANKEFDFENNSWHREYISGLLNLNTNKENVITEYRQNFVNKFINKRFIGDTK